MNTDNRLVLAANFDYDLWANLRWLEFLRVEGTESEKEIFSHILMAGSLWASRVNGESPGAMPTIPLTPDALHSIHSLWIGLVETQTWDTIIPYRRLNGEALSLPFGEIALHVTNHGTYHRGQLRGLCQARGCGSFPETDRMLFSLERMPPSL